MTNKIIGFDESGGIGESPIVFTQIEYEKENENDIIINNVINFESSKRRTS